MMHAGRISRCATAQKNALFLPFSCLDLVMFEEGNGKKGDVTVMITSSCMTQMAKILGVDWITPCLKMKKPQGNFVKGLVVNLIQNFLKSFKSLQGLITLPVHKVKK